MLGEASPYPLHLLLVEQCDLSDRSDPQASVARGSQRWLRLQPWRRRFPDELPGSVGVSEIEPERQRQIAVSGPALGLGDRIREAFCSGWSL